MAIEIKVLENVGILEMTYAADPVTAKDLAEQRALVADALAGNACGGVLIDASGLTQLPPVYEIFDHNAAVSADSVLRRTAFAVVFRSLGRDEEFLETTGVNRGLRIKCFTSKESALSWLLEESFGETSR